MKRLPKLICILLFILSLSVTVHAHPGHTDANGGHTDHSSGEYHFHHGYPVHDHYDMNGDGIVDCPYDFEDITNQIRDRSSRDSSNYNEITKIIAANAESVEQNEELKEVPEWVYLSWIFLLIVIFCLYQSNKWKKEDIARLESSCQQKIQAIQNDCDVRIAQNNATTKDLDDLLSEIDMATKNKVRLQNECRAEQIELSKIQTLRRRMNNAPPEIIFTEDGLPIYWKQSKAKPYGDYTVYVNERTRVYHTDPFCSSYTATKKHIFQVIRYMRPCKKCAEGYFDFTDIPEWFQQ